mmetsp:Transcript_2624/g.8770  ORF Transcript_2624/g.8770 Transcript_2624/m.8770 type:complete len:193 (+) Transcript_2624:79-657(+)
MAIQENVAFIPNLVTSIKGLKPFQYWVVPELPEGMVLDANTGEISGVGLRACLKSEYEIFAGNDYGQCSTKLAITVLESEWQTGYHHKLYADGSSYAGEWLDGLWHGKGELRYADGKSFTGEFHEGQRHGRGLLKDLDGCFYEGEYARGKRHGWGRTLYITGHLYEGEWSQDKRAGRGVMYDPDGTRHDIRP